MQCVLVLGSLPACVRVSALSVSLQGFRAENFTHSFLLGGPWFLLVPIGNERFTLQAAAIFTVLG